MTAADLRTRLALGWVRLEWVSIAYQFGVLPA